MADLGNVINIFQNHGNNDRKTRGQICFNFILLNYVSFTTQINILKAIVRKDTHREKEPSNKAQALTKSMNMGIQVVDTSTQLFTRGS